MTQGALKQSLLLAVVGLALSACATEPPPPPVVPTDFASRGKLNLDVQNIKVIDRTYSVPRRSPFIGHLSSPTPTEEVLRWATSRLAASGASDAQATLVIRDASVIQEGLPVTRGLEGWYTREQASQYVGRVDVVLDIQAGFSARRSVTAHAEYAVTLPEDPTDLEKQAIYRKLLNGLLDNLDRNFDQAARRYLVVSGPAYDAGSTKESAPLGVPAPSAPVVVNSAPLPPPLPAPPQTEVFAPPPSSDPAPRSSGWAW